MPGSNIDPSVWGPQAWVFLRNIAKGYPDNPTPIDKMNYKVYFESVKNVLPCSMCRNNYKKHLLEIPVTNYLKDKNTLYKWVNMMKSKTNTKQISIKNNIVNNRIVRIKDRRIERGKTRNCIRCNKK